MSDRESRAQLSACLAQVMRQVKVGGQYQHYKRPTYKVRALALREEHNEQCVVYQTEYGEHTTFIRPAATWAQKVTVNGSEATRFTLLS